MKALFLVTGGGGFIGSNMARSLLSAGHAVRILDDFSTGDRRNLADIKKDVDLIEGDIRDEETLRKCLKGVRYVLHAAALPSVPRSIEQPLLTNSVNICGTLKLLLAARDAGAERVVLSSSSSVYGDLPVLPKQEDMNPFPISPYALSKLAGEHYCRMFYDLYGLRTFSLRYFNVYGPCQSSRSQYAAAVPIFIARLLKNEAPVIYGDGNQTRDFTYVEDAVAANIKCCTVQPDSFGTVINVGGGVRISINDLAAKLTEIMGRKIKPIHEPAKKGDVKHSLADIHRAEKILGWSPQVQMDEGLRRTVSWFQKLDVKDL